MKAIVTAILFYLSAYSVTAAAAFDHDHTDLTKTLARVVVYKGDTSEVDYSALQKRPQDLIRYLKVVGRVPEKEYKTWTPEEQTAFLINAYNANTLQLVKDNFPITSIKKIAGDPWKMKFIRLFGRDYSLNELKNRLRGEHPDPKILFALNNAAVGSPRMRNEAYVANRLNDQLEDQLATFMRANNLPLDTDKKVLKLSAIFSELEADFTKAGTSLTKFVAPYVTQTPEIRSELEGGAYTVEFVDPDWNLNKLTK